jgi:hypothetical protein
MTDTLHPARSADFLSRFYDGELAPADRESFAVHRAGCAECREAADAFAAALAAFRASPTVPPAADLSARILRRIRAQSPSRRPFGVMFGIDVRWAGVFIAALLVVLISTPLVLRLPQVGAARPVALSARIVDAPAPANAPAPEPRRAAKAEAPAPAASAPAPVLLGRATEPAAASARAEAAPQKPAIREAPADEEKNRYAPGPAPAAAVAQAAPSARSRMAADASGGEAAAGAGVAAEPSEAVARLSVRPFDGEGPAPALLSRPRDARLAGLRGLEFILTVEAQGRVRAVQASSGNGILSQRTPRPSDDAAAAGDPLRDLRFAPGDRPRRLLVRVE